MQGWQFAMAKSIFARTGENSKIEIFYRNVKQHTADDNGTEETFHKGHM